MPGSTNYRLREGAKYAGNGWIEVAAENGARALYTESANIPEAVVLDHKQGGRMGIVVQDFIRNNPRPKADFIAKMAEGGPIIEDSQYNNAEISISGIKCDNCDYRDDTVLFVDYPKWVNKPCPKCGENLLTQKDYDDCLKLTDAVDLANSMPPEFLEKLVTEASESEIDAALDVMNDMKFKKTGEDTWTIK
jgi:hypothetical protein